MAEPSSVPQNIGIPGEVRMTDMGADLSQATRVGRENLDVATPAAVTSSVGRGLWLPGRTPRRPQAQRSWFQVGFGFSAGAIVAYAVAEAVVRSAQILVLVLLSAFLAVSLEPLVVGLKHLHLRRGAAVFVVLLGFAVVLGGFVALVIPPVSNEISALTKAIPGWLQEIHDHRSQLGRIEDRYHLVAKAKAQFASGDAAGKLVSGLMAAGQLIIGVFSSAFIVITLTIYFLVGMPSVRDFGLRFVAARNRPRAEDLTERILLQVGRYMLANLAHLRAGRHRHLLWCLAVGVPYAAMLGFLVAIMDMVPMVGSTVGGIAVSLVALSVSVPTAIAVPGVLHLVPVRRGPPDQSPDDEIHGADPPGRDHDRGPGDGNPAGPHRRADRGPRRHRDRSDPPGSRLPRARPGSVRMRDPQQGQE